MEISNCTRARGAALLICLLLLTSLTLLGLAAASDANLQGRMAGNLEEARLSARTADATLAWAENWLLSLDGAQRPATCGGICEPGEVIHESGSYPVAPEHESPAWWLNNGFTIGHDPVSGEVLDASLAALDGLWIIEEVHFEGADEERPDTGYYRSIARGRGLVGKSVAVTESIVARPWGDAAWDDPLPREPGQTSFCRQPGIEGRCSRLAWRQRR